MIHNGTDTSIAAARKIGPHAPLQREAVFAFIFSRGYEGATIAEIADALQMRTASVCPRCAELRGMTYGGEALPQRICDSGRRRIGGVNASSGKVWIALNPPAPELAP